MSKHIFCAFAVLFLAACSGTVDPQGLLITADRTTISANGSDVVNFTVTFNGEDVSNAKTMQLIRTFEGDSKYMSYGVNTFSTATAGTYKFKAKFYKGGDYFTEDEIEIVAEPYFSGEKKSYKRRYLGTFFTSTGCTSCPLSAAGLKELQEKKPGIISIAAFHSHFNGTDPMTIAETSDFKAAVRCEEGYPQFYWNMRKEAHVGASAHYFTYDEELLREMDRYETYSGVAVSTEYDETSSKLDVTVGITSNMPAVFRYLIILVEDNIPAVGKYTQQFLGEEPEDYYHMNAARKALTAAVGDKFNDGLPLTEGVEATASKSFVIPAGWNVENMRVIAAAMTSTDGDWTVNNVNECKIGESVSYIYEE